MKRGGMDCCLNLSRLLAFLPEQRELLDLLQPLHKQLYPGLLAVAQPPAQQASSEARVYAGAGCSGFWTSISLCRSEGLATGMAGGMVGIRGIQSEEKTMQYMNDRLASYLKRVRSLEADRQTLESKIREHLEKKGLHGLS